MTDLVLRREAATEALDAAARLAGAAILDGADPDIDAITRADSELVAVDAAEAERIRRERQAAREAADKDRAEARKEAHRARDTILAALTRAEESAKALAADFGVIQAEAGKLVALHRRLGKVIPGPLVMHELKRELSRLFAGELDTPGVRSRFGDLEWPSVPRPDWKAYSARISALLDMEQPQ